LGNPLHIAGNLGTGTALFAQGKRYIAYCAQHFAGAIIDLRHRLSRAGRQFRSVAHPGHTGLHGIHRVFGALPDRRCHLRDLFGCRGSSLGQLAHFVGHNRKAAPALARTCSFDRCVEREQIGLIRDLLDDDDHRTDLARLFAQLTDCRR